jgi:hypothetical protein
MAIAVAASAEHPSDGSNSRGDARPLGLVAVIATRIPSAAPSSQSSPPDSIIAWSASRPGAVLPFQNFTNHFSRKTRKSKKTA